MWLTAAAAAGVAALTALTTATPPAAASAATAPRSATGDSAPLHTALPPTSAPTIASPTTSGAHGTTSDGSAGTSVAVGGSGIPATVRAAYLNAQRSIAANDPGCHLSWTMLAGIGQVESGQAANGNVTANGTTRIPILGPVLDGTGGNAAIPATGSGWARAEGPMQFIPTTWATWGADGNSDGIADPNNIYDAALAAGHYLCADGRDLAKAADLDAAILSYNHSPAYLATVTAWITYYQRHGTSAASSSPLAAGSSAAPTSSQPTPSTTPTRPTATPTPTATRPSTPTTPSHSASPVGSPTTSASASPTATPPGSPTPSSPVCSPTSSPTPQGTATTGTATPSDPLSSAPAPVGASGPTISPTPSNCPSSTSTPTPSASATPSP